MKSLNQKPRGASSAISFRIDDESLSALYAIIDNTGPDIRMANIMRAFIVSGLEQYQKGEGAHPDIAALQESAERHMKRMRQLEKIADAPSKVAKLEKELEEARKQLAKVTQLPSASPPTATPKRGRVSKKGAPRRKSQ